MKQTQEKNKITHIHVLQMGYSYSFDDTPLMCFNAYNSWQLGWYHTKSITFRSPHSLIFSGGLSGIVDYQSNATKTVLIRIETTNATYYMNYNKKTHFNSGTREGANQVLVVEVTGPGMGMGSNLVGKLDAGDSFVLQNGTDTGNNILIRVNSINVTGSAQVYIGPLKKSNRSITQ